MAFVFFFTSLGTGKAFSDNGQLSLASLPLPGQMVNLTPVFTPALLKGLKLDANNPLRFNFIVEPGDTKFGEAKLKEEVSDMVRYFLAALTIPESDLWVNLSPFEGGRVITDELSSTDLGRDMLASDYLLKQLVSSLTYPESALGKKFWEKVYRRANEVYGTAKIPVNTFNKIWIMPESASIFENGDKVVISDIKLKVMLEADYFAMQNNQAKDQKTGKPKNEKTFTTGNQSDGKAVNDLSGQIMKEIILPVIEQEVNHGQSFAKLRQIIYSVILAGWFKLKLKDSIVNQTYSDKKKMKGVDTSDPALKEKIYQQYVQAYKKGVYDYIKKEFEANSHRQVRRRYFSGGVELLYGKLVGDTQRVPPEAFAGKLSSPLEAEAATVELAPASLPNSFLGEVPPGYVSPWVDRKGKDGPIDQHLPTLAQYDNVLIAITTGPEAVEEIVTREGPLAAPNFVRALEDNAMGEFRKEIINVLGRIGDASAIGNIVRFGIDYIGRKTPAGEVRAVHLAAIEAIKNIGMRYIWNIDHAFWMLSLAVEGIGDAELHAKAIDALREMAALMVKTNPIDDEKAVYASRLAYYRQFFQRLLSMARTKPNKRGVVDYGVVDKDVRIVAISALAPVTAAAKDNRFVSDPEYDGFLSGVRSELTGVATDEKDNPEVRAAAVRALGVMAANKRFPIMIYHTLEDMFTRDSPDMPDIVRAALREVLPAVSKDAGTVAASPVTALKPAAADEARPGETGRKRGDVLRALRASERDLATLEAALEAKSWAYQLYTAGFDEAAAGELTDAVRVKKLPLTGRYRPTDDGVMLIVHAEIGAISRTETERLGSLERQREIRELDDKVKAKRAQVIELGWAARELEAAQQERHAVALRRLEELKAKFQKAVSGFTSALEEAQGNGPEAVAAARGDLDKLLGEIQLAGDAITQALARYREEGIDLGDEALVAGTRTIGGKPAEDTILEVQTIIARLRVDMRELSDAHNQAVQETIERLRGDTRELALVSLGEFLSDRDTGLIRSGASKNSSVGRGNWLWNLLRSRFTYAVLIGGVLGGLAAFPVARSTNAVKLDVSLKIKGGLTEAVAPASKPEPGYVGFFQLPEQPSPWTRTIVVKAKKGDTVDGLLGKYNPEWPELSHEMRMGGREALRDFNPGVGPAYLIIEGKRYRIPAYVSSAVAEAAQARDRDGLQGELKRVQAELELALLKQRGLRGEAVKTNQRHVAALERRREAIEASLVEITLDEAFKGLLDLEQYESNLAKGNEQVGVSSKDLAGSLPDLGKQYDIFVRWLVSEYDRIGGVKIFPIPASKVEHLTAILSSLNDGLESAQVWQKEISGILSRYERLLGEPLFTVDYELDRLRPVVESAPKTNELYTKLIADINELIARASRDLAVAREEARAASHHQTVTGRVVEKRASASPVGASSNAPVGGIDLNTAKTAIKIKGDGNFAFASSALKADASGLLGYTFTIVKLEKIADPTAFFASAK